MRFGILLSTLAAVVACTGSASTASYQPREREITITTVPLLVKEEQKLFPFLPKAFAKGGPLDGKEVYAFSPSSITAVEGDTLRFSIVNPEDDTHSFVLQDLSVALPPASVTKATYVARHRGIFSFQCSIPSHLPMMWGQLIVLAPDAVR